MKKDERYKLLKFGILFAALCGLFHAIILLTPETFKLINEYTALAMGILLSVFGLQPAVEDAFVSAGGFSVVVVHECSALLLFVLFGSFVLAYPTNMKNKAIGLLFGIPSLFAVNTVRLVIVFLAGLWYPALFEYIHVYLWQTIIIILIFIACLAWLDLVVMVRTRDTPMAFLERFIAFSSVPFLIWLGLNKAYGAVILKMSEFVLNGVGYTVQGLQIEVMPDPSVGVYTATFNLVAFVALILATRSIGWDKKIKAMLIGLPVIIVGHIVFSVFEVIAGIQGQQQQAFQVMLTAQLVGQYFLPFGLWLAFTYKDVFKPAGTCICPICGKEVVGIEEHVRKKHGKKALKKEEVKALLEERRSRIEEYSGRIKEWMKKRFKDMNERIRKKE